MRDDRLTAADLEPLVDKLSTEERLRLANYAIRIAHQLRVHKAQTEGKPPQPQHKGRRAGLHRGAISITADFDDALPDEFWLGSP